MLTQAQIDKLVESAVSIANDDSHGYSNVVGDNYGANGDFDCGGLVSYSLYLAGILPKGTMFEPNERYGNAWSYGTVLEPIGFVQMPFDYNSVKKGDILIKDGHHTELAIGNYQQVGAHDNYDGVRGDYGHAGEISVVPLTQGYWDYMYRPTISDEAYSSKWEVVTNIISGKTNKKIEKLFKPVFNATYYYKKYKTFLQGAGISNNSHELLQHFLNEGMGGNMQGSSTFDCTYYEQNYDDLRKAFSNNYPCYYIHYLQYGEKEGRKTYLCTDVPADNKYYTYIKYCIDKGLFKSKKTFGINNHMTRLGLALILYRLAGKPAVSTGTIPYSDISDLTTAQKKAVWFCYTNKYITGYKDGTFRPDKEVTKKAVILYLYRFKGNPTVSGTITYTDVTDKKGSTSYNAILWARKNHIVGKNNNKFKPKAAVKKCTMAVYLYRFLGGK